MILLERDSDLDGTFDERLYPMQNWRSDVIGMISDTGKQRGQTRYDPYGVPFGIFAGDQNDDGVWDNGDLSILSAALNASQYHVRYDEDLDGTFDGDDITAFNNLTKVGGGRHSPSLENLPFTYAGYEQDPDLAGSKMHVRNRVYLADAGLWSKRDIKIIDSWPAMYRYAESAPIIYRDPMGLIVISPIIIFNDLITRLSPEGKGSRNYGGDNDEEGCNYQDCKGLDSSVVYSNFYVTTAPGCEWDGDETLVISQLINEALDGNDSSIGTDCPKGGCTCSCINDPWAEWFLNFEVDRDRKVDLELGHPCQPQLNYTRTVLHWECHGHCVPLGPVG